MQTIRRVHALIGCFAAPLTLLLAVTGALQAFDYHKTPKDGSYHPWKWVVAASKFHKNEYFRADTRAKEACVKVEDPAEALRCLEEAKHQSESMLLRKRVLGFFLVAGAISLFSNAVSGIGMALQSRRLRISALVLVALGLAIPIFLGFC